MAHSEAEFNLVCEQYKEHYLQQELSELERKLVTDFITYFLAQWEPGSHAAQCIGQHCNGMRVLTLSA